MQRTWLFFFFILFFLPSVIQEKTVPYRGLASSWNMIPSQSLAGLYYLFKGYSVDDEGGRVKVSGPVVVITNGRKIGASMYEDGYVSEIDPEDFEDEQELAQSVFRATTRNRQGIGTAFLVGANVVLTNRHVLNYKKEDKKWSCGDFSIKLNLRNEQVGCEKVRFCSSKFDFCVVQMKKMSNGLSLGSEMKPLRMARKVKGSPDAMVLHIGNAAGLGIQASHGKGIILKEGEIFHFAPTLGGSSGAPIFNEKREVIGINWGFTGNESMDESYNRAVSSLSIFEELQKTHLYTLKEIKSFRTWLNRNHGHREVKIKTN